MPTYEYQCNNCGHSLEAWQKMSDDPLIECPECHQNALRKVLSAVGGFHLKGSGWYATDFKDKKPAPCGGNAETCPVCPAATSS